MSDNKYERPTVSVQKQLRRSAMSLDKKRSRRVQLRLKTGVISKAYKTMCDSDGNLYESY